MSKILIEESDVVDPASMKVLEDIARFFNRLDDPYRMPETMIEYFNKQRQGGVDIYHQSVIGFGYEAMSLRCTFKRDMLVMEFTAPDGMRLMELRLHV